MWDAASSRLEQRERVRPQPLPAPCKAALHARGSWCPAGCSTLVPASSSISSPPDPVGALQNLYASPSRGRSAGDEQGSRTVPLFCRVVSLFIHSPSLSLLFFFFPFVLLALSGALSTGNLVSSTVFLWDYTLEEDQAERDAVRPPLHPPAPAHGCFAPARDFLQQSNVPVGAELPTVPSTGRFPAPLPSSARCPLPVEEQGSIALPAAEQSHLVPGSGLLQCQSLNDIAEGERRAQYLPVKVGVLQWGDRHAG